MSDEKKEVTAEEKARAAAEAKAKAAAAAKAKAAAAAKAKAAAAAKAKAAAEAKAKAEEGEAASGATDEEKAKAAAAAKAKAAAAAKAKAAAAAKAKAAAEAKAKAGEGAATDDEKAKAIAAAKAKAAAAAKARAKAAAGGQEAAESEKPKEPSVNQPYLDKYVKVITDNIGADVIEEAYINELGKEVPTLVIKRERWFEVAQFLRNNEQLAFDYLSNLHGTDFETHMETYYHFYSYKEKQSIAIRVKLDRDNPSVASITPIWAGANWPEREAYDLLGITFEGHPNLTRILLPDDWVGHPLRKDYVQHDEEV